MHPCAHCNKTFSRAYDAKRHTVMLHGIREPSAQNVSSPPQPQQLNSQQRQVTAPTHQNMPPGQDTPPPPRVTPRPPPQGETAVVLQHPFTMLVTGPTGSGKSTWVKELLMRRDFMIRPSPQRIMWFYRRWQPLYTELHRLVPRIEFIQGIPPTIKRDDFFNTRYPTLFIIDDLMRDATHSADVCELFTEGSHHRNLSVICLLQNLFYKGKESRTMSLNSQYLVLFTNPRDQQQVSVLARQMYPGRSHFFMEEYRAATEQPYGYLLVDLKQTTPNDRRLRSKIFHDSYTEPNVSAAPVVRNSGDQTGKHLSRPTETHIDASLDDGSHFSSSNLGVHTSHVPSSSRAVDGNLKSNQNMAANHSSCVACGALYASPMDLRRHMIRGCPEDDDDDEEDRLLSKRRRQDYSEDFDEESESDAGRDDRAFQSLINKAYGRFDKLYSEKVDKFTEDGMREKAAEREASDSLRSKYRDALMKNYNNFLRTLYRMKSSPLHDRVLMAI